MAEQSFKEALGDGLWVLIIDGKVGSPMANGSVQYKDQSFFHQLEEEGVPLELHPNKVTTLFNYARLLEEIHDSVRASLFYRFIIFKVLLFLSLLKAHDGQYYQSIKILLCSFDSFNILCMVYQH
jgi:hypothetical protein